MENEAKESLHLLPVADMINELVPDVLPKGINIKKVGAICVAALFCNAQKNSGISPANERKNIKKTIESLDYALGFFKPFSKTSSPFVDTLVASGRRAVFGEQALHINEVFCELLVKHGELLEEMLEFFDENKKSKAAYPGLTATQTRNKCLEDLANVLTCEYNYNIDDARLSAAKTFKHFNIDVPGMNEETDPIDRRRILQEVMPNVKKQEA